ncbi:hypothetical protein H0O03_00430 [Candidatus Micrarchaeota archaeon]|nr:hypothetical protein [Candidatus Micrarchaeota archaeon]
MKQENLFWKAAFFSETGLQYFSENAGPKLAAACLLAAAVILSFPTDFSQASVSQAIASAGIVFVALAAAALLSFGFARALGGRASLKQFFVSAVGAFATSLALISLPLGAIGLLAFNVLLGDPRMGALLFSIVPFYNYVVFGWACEEKSGLKHSRATATGVFGASAVLAVYLALSALIA